MTTNDLRVTATPLPVSNALDVNIVGNIHGVDLVEWVSVVLSLVAIAISVYTIIQTRTTHKATLASAFYTSIFERYLIDHLPSSREKVCFDNGKIFGHEMLVDKLNELRRKILYFKYADNEFYMALRNELQNLENYIVQAMNTQYDSTAQTEFFAEVDNRLAQIFVRISKRHCGI